MTSLTVEFYFANSEFHCYVHAAIMCINSQGLRYLILNTQRIQPVSRLPKRPLKGYNVL